MTNVKLTWQGDSAGIYEVQYKKVSDDSWRTPVSSPVTGLFVSINNLDENIDYTFRVREYCPNGPQSPWIYDNFRTPVTQCIAPANVHVSNVHETTVDVSWTASSTAIGGYYVEYRVEGVSSWLTTSLVSSTHYTLSGLSNGTAYQVRVKSVCANGAQSTSSSISFTTVEVLSQCANIVAGTVSITINTSNYVASYSNAGGTPSTHTLEYSTDGGNSWGNITNIFNQTVTSATYNLPGIVGIFPVSHKLRVTPKCADGSLGTSATGSYTAPVVFTQYVTFQNRLDAGSISAIHIDGNPNILTAPLAINGDSKWNQDNFLGSNHTITGELTGTSNGTKLLTEVIRGTTTVFSGNSIFYTGSPFTWIANQQLLNGDIVRVKRDSTVNINATLKMNVNDYTDHCHSQGAGWFVLNLNQSFPQPITIQFAYGAYNTKFYNVGVIHASAGGDIVPQSDVYKASISSTIYNPAQIVIPANTTSFTNSNSNTYNPATSLVWLNKDDSVSDFLPGDIIGEHGGLLTSLPDCNLTSGSPSGKYAEHYRIYYKILTPGVNLTFTAVSGDVSAPRIQLIKV